MRRSTRQTLPPSSGSADVKPANPSAGLGLVQVPSAIQQGDASTAYPITVPPGRAGLQPQLSLSYSSSGGNGWVGVGWDLPVTSVGIETRWGVPRYDPAKETETYTLAGAQLTPLAHRAEPVAREADEVFHARVETQFNHIVRHGTGPANYWWEVTDKNGVHSYFGGTPSGGLNTNAILRDGNQNIFRWALVEAHDANGNGVHLEYEPVSDFGLAKGTVLGHQLYLKSINYTRSSGAEGPYTVDCIRDSQLPGYVPRPDVQIAARGGFKLVTASTARPRGTLVSIRLTGRRGMSLIRWSPLSPSSSATARPPRWAARSPIRWEVTSTLVSTRPTRPRISRSVPGLVSLPATTTRCCCCSTQRRSPA
jgi:hypothetical protein